MFEWGLGQERFSVELPYAYKLGLRQEQSVAH